MFCIRVKIELWARWVNSLPLSVASWMYDYHKSQFTVMSFVDFKRLVWIHSSLLWVKTRAWIHPPRNHSYITGKKEFLIGLVRTHSQKGGCGLLLKGLYKRVE